MTSLKNRSIAASAALFATLITVAAATPVRAEALSIPVGYTDLDLSKDSGVATLNRRVAYAAERICGPADAGNRFEIANCRRSIVDTAQANVSAVTARRSVPALAAR